mmetsp:Transcript_21262/g.46353  ORF Transcript_21262/g.46353 Transcript_21262/m.46353 type:complete len:83 (-) Transcript_21262:1354-1602(-)
MQVLCPSEKNMYLAEYKLSRIREYTFDRVAVWHIINSILQQPSDSIVMTNYTNSCLVPTSQPLNEVFFAISPFRMKWPRNRQ